MEVFPVKIAFRGGNVWLGWVSPEDGHSFFLTNGGRLIFSCDSKEGLTKEVMSISPDAQIDVESFFDFNSIIDGFDKNDAVRGNLVLDAWNLLIDLYYTFDGAGKIFLKPSVDVYRRLFSQSDVALMIDVYRSPLSARDVEVMRDVFLDGVDFLAEKVNDAKKAKSH